MYMFTVFYSFQAPTSHLHTQLVETCSLMSFRSRLPNSPPRHQRTTQSSVLTLIFMSSENRFLIQKSACLDGWTEIDGRWFRFVSIEKTWFEAKVTSKPFIARVQRMRCNETDHVLSVHYHILPHHFHCRNTACLWVHSLRPSTVPASTEQFRSWSWPQPMITKRHGLEALIQRRYSFNLEQILAVV